MRETTAGTTGPRWPPEFVRFYEDEFAGLVRLCRLVVGRLDVAEEVAQEALLALAARWQVVDKPVSYARRSAVHGCYRHLKRAGMERALVRECLPQVVPPTSDGELWDALQNLTPRRRAAVVMRYWQDLDDACIGEALGCRPATVRSLIHRALNDLRRAVA